MEDSNPVQVAVAIVKGFVVVEIKAANSLSVHVVLSANEAEMFIDLIRRGIDRLTPN